MKTFQMTLSLTAALLAMPAMAQDESTSNKKKSLHYAIDAGKADFAIALVSDSSATVKFDAKWILRDAAAVLMRKDGDKFMLDMNLPDGWSRDLYVQSATYDAKQGLKIHDIHKLDADQLSRKQDAMNDAPEARDADQPNETLDRQVDARDAEQPRKKSRRDANR